VLNKAPRHEDVWRNGCTAPRNLNLVTRWRCATSLWSRPDGHDLIIIKLPLCLSTTRWPGIGGVKVKLYAF